MALTLALGFQSCGDDGDVDEPAAPSPEAAVDSTSNTPSQPVSNPDSTGNADKPADLLPISFTVNGVDFEMAPIPGGKYQELDFMGEVTATHEIQPFYMMTTGCTQALWAAVMGCNPSKDFGSGKCIGDNYPVNNVSWSDVAGDVDFNKTVYSAVSLLRSTNCLARISD